MISLGSQATSLRWLRDGAFAVGLVVLVVSACTSTISEPPDQSSNNVGGFVTTVSSTSSVEGCAIPESGFCITPDDCACDVCAPTALCMPGEGCLADLICEPDTVDVCTCSDCDGSSACKQAGNGECVNDGQCDTAAETCACPDCANVTTCKDNVASCSGAPDGICSAGESCSCPDCMGQVECVCVADFFCREDEPCVCFDCDFCDPEDPAFCGKSCGACDNNGVCDWHVEGCGCGDCSAFCVPPG